MHIALTGYYGFGNAGDDAILQAVVETLRSSGVDHITVITYPGGDLDDVRHLADVVAVDGADIKRVDQAIAEADRLVIGGGGLIQDYLPTEARDRFSERHSNLGFWSTLAIIARAKGVPTMTWALGVGPLTTEGGRAEASLFFTAVDRVTVRDAESASLARELGVADPTIVADPAFLLDPARDDPIDADIEDLPISGSMRVVASVRHWGDDEWMDPLAEALDRLVEERGADIIFLPFQHSGRGLANDLLVSTRVAARMKHRANRAVLGTELSPSETLAAVATADLVIGMRLHSVVFASVAGVPAVALAYDPKVRLAMEGLGLGDQVQDLGEITADWLVDTATRARPANETLVDELRRAARQPAAFLRDVTPGSVGPLTPVVVDAAIARAIEARELHIELAAHNQVVMERDNLIQAYDKLAKEYQTFLDSRAAKLARQVWTVRAQLKDLPGLGMRAAKAVARRVLPASVRRRLRGSGAAPASDAPVLSEQELAAARERIETDLDRFVATHADGPGFVILPPSIGWNVALFQRPQQLALAFARLGYGVIYHLEAKFSEGVVGYHRQTDGLLVGYLPDELADLLHRVPDPIYLSYVYNFDWRRHLETPITVYEHIDDLEVFEHVYKRDRLDDWHARAMAEADVVAASAVDLLTEVRETRPDAVLVANGVDFDHFSGDHPRPDDLADIPADARVVGYYGALAEWFDYDLLHAAARRLADWHFVLIGPDYDGTASTHPALALPNVHWLGTRPYATLPAYLDAFTVATIPFVVNDVTHAVSPLKLFEYMAGGKPVVTPPLRECARYRAVQIGEGVDGFVAEIERAAELTKDPAHVDLLRRTAKANTWEARARTIIEAVEARR